MLSKINNRGQVGETLTWVVATLIIVFILVSSVYVAILLGKAKSLDSIGSGNSIEESFVGIQTLKAYEKNSENKIQIDNWLMEVENEKQESEK